MSPPLIVFWIKNKIKELAERGRGIVISGSPRTFYEAKQITPLFKKSYGPENIKFILLELNEKKSILRNSHRRTCELMRHPILYTKETAELTRCPLDGSKLVSRKDDTSEVVKVRLREYKERTLPLLDYIKEEGFEIKKINGEQSVEKVFQDILKAIK